MVYRKVVERDGDAGIAPEKVGWAAKGLERRGGALRCLVARCGPAPFQYSQAGL